MKLRNLIPVAFAATVIMSGCSSDSPVDPSVNREGDTGYTAFSINVKGSSSRADASDQWADAVEQAVAGVDVYVFADGHLETSKTPQLNANVTAPIEVSVGAKTVYAVANSPFDITEVAKGTSIADFEAKLFASLKADVATPGHFPMVGSGTHTVVKNTESEARLNPVKLSVSRAAAKLQVRYSTAAVSINPSINASFSQAVYGATQCPKQMYVTLGDNFTPLGTAPAAGIGTYPGLWTPASYNDAFFTAAVADFTADHTKSDYLGECVVSTPTTGRVPFALVRIKVTPSKIYDDKTLSADGTFTVLARNDASTASWVFAADADYNLLYFAAETDATAYATSNSLSGYNAYTYTKGQAYYRINLITDPEATSLSEKYRVVRNHFYKVNVTDVKALGAPTADGVIPTDPEQPLDADAWIAAEIEIADWEPVDQNASLQ